MLSNNIDRTPEGVLTFAGYDVTKLAKEYGTPLYLMDEARIRANCRMYLQAFRDHFGPGSLPLYASKAASFKQMYRIMAEEGMGVDVVSSGELYTALSAGFPAERIYFHGNCKTDADLAYGVSQGIGFFVADNREELLALEKTAAEANVTQKILLRVTPGIDPHTYEAVSTGKVDSKFGAAVETGQAMELVKLALTLPHLDLRGLHCHVGSQVFGEDVYQRTLDIMVPFLASSSFCTPRTSPQEAVRPHRPSTPFSGSTLPQYSSTVGTPGSPIRISWISVPAISFSACTK